MIPLFARYLYQHNPMFFVSDKVLLTVATYYTIHLV